MSFGLINQPTAGGNINIFLTYDYISLYKTYENINYYF